MSGSGEDIKQNKAMQFLRGVGFALLLFAVLIAFSFWQFGSLPNAFAYVRGEDYVLSSRVVDVGEGEYGEIREGAILIRNLTFKPIRIVGLDASCRCAASEPLPITIAPRETRQFSVKVSLGGKGGSIERAAQIMFDSHGHMSKASIVLQGECPAYVEEGKNENNNGTSDST